MLAAQFISSELWMKLHAHNLFRFHFLVQFTVIYKHQLKFNVKKKKKISSYFWGERFVAGILIDKLRLH